MIKLQNFRKLIELIKESDKELNRYEDLNILLSDERLIGSHWEIQSLLLESVFNEAQLDFFNWWVYENYMGDGFIGTPMKFSLNGRDFYTGKDMDKIWEELDRLK